MPNRPCVPAPYTVALRRLALYFLKLGATGFGGPVALAHHMRRDLVETRGWLSEQEYADGLAIATACPGPLAYQLGVYCGYVRYGVGGALTVAVAFALAPFLCVSLIAALYQRFTGNWEVQALFYGIAPVVVALILKACWQLGRKTLGLNPATWIFALMAGGITLLVRRELVTLFILAGLAGCLVFRSRVAGPSPDAPAPPPASAGAGLVLAGGASAVPALKLFTFFFKTGLLVFGSGLVIAPFLKAYVVDQYHWLSDRQFLDALAVGLITPGPVVITATFVGYLLDGLRGAVAATAGIFAPAVLFTIVAAPLLRRYRSNRYVQGFVQGIVCAVIGTLVATSLLVARDALRDTLTVVLAVASLVAVLRWPRLPEPVLVLAGALAGVISHWL